MFLELRLIDFLNTTSYFFLKLQCPYTGWVKTGIIDALDQNSSKI